MSVSFAQTRGAGSTPAPNTSGVCRRATTAALARGASSDDGALELNHFVDSSLVDYRISDIHDEALRRMEIHLLRLLHRFNSTLTEASPRSARTKDAATGGGCAQLRRLRDQMMVLQLLHKNVQEGSISTQRDIYYHLVRCVRNQDVVNAVVQQLVEQLQLPRQALGVVAGSRGCVGGTLTYRGVHLRALGPGAGGHEGSAEGAPIPSTEEEVRVCALERAPSMAAASGGPFCILPQTRFILVIEKHAVFYRLMAERLYGRVPCVLVTSHGFPTHTARLLLHNLHAAAPHLPVVGLVDYNPSGLAILLQFKWGQTGMRENTFTSVPALRWLGVRAAQLPLHRRAEEGAALALPRGMPHKPFTERDAALLTTLAKRMEATWQEQQHRTVHTAAEDLGKWLAEVTTMHQCKIKVELEALYSDTYQHPQKGETASGPSSSVFSAWVCQHLLRRDFI
ncbi:meiotic recombination protein SPO11 [Strigomonas culicis]|uniref:DNA topoisomerase (ATP-hydrolyzing) n=1 Tax=Strigomonas culicis TaxID=28005 RepID=S9W774_9TRYP|nr:meiotic recombination protein SPO11 [Strigomonas culicis]|eukprot:EPY31825.1 meiotic recombination protein SPO11 [Strigomonas culicis]